MVQRQCPLAVLTWSQSSTSWRSRLKPVLKSSFMLNPHSSCMSVIVTPVPFGPTWKLSTMLVVSPPISLSIANFSCSERLIISLCRLGSLKCTVSHSNCKRLRLMYPMRTLFSSSLSDSLALMMASSSTLISPLPMISLSNSSSSISWMKRLARLIRIVRTPSPRCLFIRIKEVTHSWISNVSTVVKRVTTSHTAQRRTQKLQGSLTLILHYNLLVHFIREGVLGHLAFEVLVVKLCAVYNYYTSLLICSVEFQTCTAMLLSLVIFKSSCSFSNSNSSHTWSLSRALSSEMLTICFFGGMSSGITNGMVFPAPVPAHNNTVKPKQQGLCSVELPVIWFLAIGATFKFLHDLETGLVRVKFVWFFGPVSCFIQDGRCTSGSTFRKQ